MKLMSLKHIAKKFVHGDTETIALKDISFDIDKGEFVAIMGPSGSGKSTLLQILSFLDKGTAGSYTFKGKEVSEYSEDDLAHLRNEALGFVFQAFHLLPRLDVYENIKLPLTYSKVPPSEWDKRVKEAIASVNLTHRAHHQPSELSGGEKQRVAIARALVLEPEVIFADEPTGNLDSKSGKLIMDLFDELHKKHGHTILLITHETSTAQYAERIIRIMDGEVEREEKVAPRVAHYEK